MIVKKHLEGNDSASLYRMTYLYHSTTIKKVSLRMRSYQSVEEVPMDPIELSIFGHRFMSIAEQMGVTLQRTSASTNIKERLDFSVIIEAANNVDLEGGKRLILGNL